MAKIFFKHVERFMETPARHGPGACPSFLSASSPQFTSHLSVWCRASLQSVAPPQLHLAYSCQYILLPRSCFKPTLHQRLLALFNNTLVLQFPPRCPLSFGYFCWFIYLFIFTCVLAVELRSCAYRLSACH